ncbi:MAG: DUF5320 domain-containing protein [Candidatus Dojkabacteria bacterium]|jgi:hypothetical protein
MPNFDGTGPQGEGPKTGLGRGNCQNPSAPQKKVGVGKRNRPRGRGRGLRVNKSQVA